MPDESVRLDPTAITFLGEPFELVPVVHDILRTRYCVPETIFLVEGIDRVSVSRSGRWQAIRIVLGDGALCIQALLGSDMHRFVQTGDIALGAYVRCKTFHAKWQDVRGQSMVTLVVDDLITIGWNESYRILQEEDELMTQQYPDPATQNDQDAKPTQNPPEQLEEKLEEPSKPQQDMDFDDDDEEVVEEAFEAFETLMHAPKPKTPQKTPTSKQPIALPRDWHNPQTPLKLTTLRSIPHLPYKQNWSCNVLAIIASLSDLEPSNLPPYRQRTARLVDPSTAKQVHLTVFLDPEQFGPRIGSVVLLVGVKNHRFDGGSLKKYESDRKNGRWWFENPVELNWCDVEGIKAWWSEVTQITESGG
ncbi:Ff.00g007490.m01.CDS01 [Fusarium sp. VM40]|nr:Ff.00g007490.m01.CDS01 [Fusarium sp. VM40]